MDISEDFVINRQREQRYDPNRPRTDPSRKSVVGMHVAANAKLKKRPDSVTNILLVIPILTLE